MWESADSARDSESGERRAVERHRLEAEVEACDRVVARCGHASDLACRVEVVEALVGKAVALWKLDRPQESVVAGDEVLVRVADTTEAALVEQAARALWSRGTALTTLGRFREAVLAYDGVLVRCATANEPALRHLARRVLIIQNMALQSLEQSDDEHGLPGPVLARFEAAWAAERAASRVRAVRRELMRAPRDYLCPVCGWRMAEPPWEAGIGSQEICPCCGIRFGYDDARVEHAQIHAEHRERWISAGMPWGSAGPVPDGWDPQAQCDALTGEDRHPRDPPS